MASAYDFFHFHGVLKDSKKKTVTPPLSFVGGANRCFRKVKVNGALCNLEGAAVDNQPKLYIPISGSLSATRGRSARFTVAMVLVVKNGGQAFLEVLLPGC